MIHGFAEEGTKRCRPQHNQPWCYQRRAHRMLATIHFNRQEKKKKKNHPYNSSPGLARKRVPIQEWGMCQLQQHQQEPHDWKQTRPPHQKRTFLLTMIKK